jgi:hypothetical protein
VVALASLFHERSAVVFTTIPRVDQKVDLRTNARIFVLCEREFTFTTRYESTSPKGQN